MPKTAASSIQTQAAKKNGFWAVLKKYHAFYLMLIPGILYFAIFKYGPMWGLTRSKIITPSKGCWAANL